MKQITTPLPQNADYLPVVLVRKNLNRFAEDKGIRLTQDSDDFDKFTMAHLQLETDKDCDFLLVHYAGSDDDTFDIWLSTDSPNPSKCLLDIIRELHLSSEDVVLRQLSGSAFSEPARDRQKRAR